jgi:2-oxoglutarate dehydrogenase E2 component (dihydrolipoamide succinyltransferase)
VAPAAPAAPAAAPVAAVAVPRPRAPGEVETREERLRTRSTPLVRRIAAEHGVDIATIPGSGFAGRVTKKDILSFLESARVAPAAPRPTGAPAPPLMEPVEEGVIVAPIHGATLRIRIPPVPIKPSDRVEEMSVMRQRIVEHMILSRRISAHVTTVFEIDFERVAQLRSRWKADFEARGVKLTYTPFVIKAVVEGLKAYPVLNASVVGNKIIYHGEINIGIAVAIEEGRGLIVPVVKNADHLSLFGLTKTAQDLAERARTKRLIPEEVQGGTFTITNPGVFGSLFGTPIINQPQVAILGTGVVEKRPVVIHDAIAIRHRAYFGISYDHRVVDGAMADFFMNKVKDVIENFPEDAA